MDEPFRVTSSSLLVENFSSYTLRCIASCPFPFFTSRCESVAFLRIDNSRHGMIHVLWNISRTTIATKPYDISCERENSIAYVGVSIILFLDN